MKFKCPSKSSIPVDYQLPVTHDLNCVDVMGSLGLGENMFVKGRELKYYIVQEDCVCCS